MPLGPAVRRQALHAIIGASKISARTAPAVCSALHVNYLDRCLGVELVRPALADPSRGSYAFHRPSVTPAGPRNQCAQTPTPRLLELPLNQDPVVGHTMLGRDKDTCRSNVVVDSRRPSRIADRRAGHAGDLIFKRSCSRARAHAVIARYEFPCRMEPVELRCLPPPGCVPAAGTHYRNKSRCRYGQVPCRKLSTDHDDRP